MEKKKPDYRLLNHTADLGLEVQAKDLKGLFRAAALAMMEVMVRKPRSRKTDERRLSVSAMDLADLMVRWLGEILYLFQGEAALATEVRIETIAATGLDATVSVVPFDPGRHEILCEIKAVTYHQIAVVEDQGVWTTRVVFDL